MFIFKRDKLKEKKETVTGNPSKRQKVADPAKIILGWQMVCN